ncbi:hypothetical protein EW093_07640 [Thiospirochaeta perfilievii]|uniref:DUF2178 domain-containing protein n=1 Tax=Thiospirochaeta perfilievii TaxID=252967 RepID=A0A5C1QBX1_9SPIO|nr:hypothetical protein [Thiospirochaeta perfilievii]QEN04580.1 hypothetical protein EW093_07640 [Thiospirochaeta perfilievii]
MKGNLKLKILKFLDLINISLWLIIGLITIGSIFLSSIGYVINLVVGSIFISIAIFFNYKRKYLFELLKKTCIDGEDILTDKVINGEIVGIISALILGIIIFTAVYSRVFIEGFPVFG